MRLPELSLLKVTGLKGGSTSLGFNPKSPSASLKFMDRIKESAPSVVEKFKSLNEISGVDGKLSGGEIQDPATKRIDNKIR
jgi:hypothetical protein